MKGQQQQPQHVVLFPFMGHGHFTPFIALADLLQRRQPELTITIINTPLNIQTIQSSLPPNSTIRLRSIPFTPFDHGLPPAAESMADIPRHHFHTFFLAVESLKPHFEKLLHQIIEEDGHLPFIISDIFLAWTVEIAHKLGIFHSILFTGGAYGFSMLFSLTVNFPPSILPITGTEFSSPDFPHVHIHCTQLPRSVLVGNVPHLFFRRLLSYCSQSDAVLVNTVKEFETTGLCMLEKLTGVHALPVGPLFIKPSSSFSSLHSDARCIEWLDSHPPGSVLYVSFGSQNSINGSQMMELAAGLEASGKPFIWAIRPPYGADNMAEEYFKQEWLPEGFEERMRLMNQGLLVHGWAPQVEILAHGSTAAILSHCGWNAVQESLSYGVPIIGWPIGADQIYNSKFLEEEVGVCVELGRGNMESMSVEVDRERVKNVVEMVMGGKEKGGELKKKAMEIRMMMRGALLDGGNGDKGSSIQILEEFLNAARSTTS